MHLAALLARARAPCVHIRTPDQLSLELRSRVGSERAARPRWLGHAHALLREGRVLRSGRSRACVGRAARPGMVSPGRPRVPPPAAENARRAPARGGQQPSVFEEPQQRAARGARRVQPARAAVGALEPRAGRRRAPAPRGAPRARARPAMGTGHVRAAANSSTRRQAARRRAALGGGAPRPRSCVSSSVSRAASRAARRPKGERERARDDIATGGFNQKR